MPKAKTGALVTGKQPNGIINIYTWGYRIDAYNSDNSWLAFLFLRQ